MCVICDARRHARAYGNAAAQEQAAQTQMKVRCHLVTGCGCRCGFRKRHSEVPATPWPQSPEEKDKVLERRNEQVAHLERQVEGLQRENERLARQAHALNLQLNRTEKELHEAKLAVGHAMNFAILLAKSVK